MKQWGNRWNSFNSAKALVHVPYWKGISNGTIPSPLTVCIDPCGVCDLNCPHCNAAAILQQHATIMSVDTIGTVIGQLKMWRTKGAIIGGGGEPTLNKNISFLIDSLCDANIQCTLVTNGTMLHKIPMGVLQKLTYLGISVDAATDETWQKIKNNKIKNYSIDKIFNNISGVTGRGLEVTYKYLLVPGNEEEVYAACKKAKELGCDQFHFRPGSEPWFNDEKSYNFDAAKRESVMQQLDQARTDFESNDFKIFGVVHKLDETWKTRNAFPKCWASFTTCIIGPDGNVGLCCDRRGDTKVNLGTIDEMSSLWGSQKHKDIMSTISPSECPRCTLGHVNEIFENAILKDTMFYNFF